MKAYGEVAEHDRVPAFVEHLDLLREAGDDPAVAEADPDDDAVPVLTVHKAKGLEFPVVFLVGCVGGEVPGAAARATRWSCRRTCSAEAAAGGDAHLHEERRLFYVAMTRAKDELVLTSAADYGTARARKVSRFVVEALDLPSPAPAPRKSQALEALARHQPRAGAAPGRRSRRCPPEESCPCRSAQIDDYQTCPLKYKYVHRLRVPAARPPPHRLRQRHAQGGAGSTSARGSEGRPFGEDDLVAAFRAAWVSEGFLSREHEEQRLRAGEETLRRFHGEEADATRWRRPRVEQEFAFFVDRTQGRRGATTSWSSSGGAGHDPRLQDRRGGRPRSARGSGRGRACSSTSTRWPICATTGRLPDRVELRFLESGLAGGKRPTLEEAARHRGSRSARWRPRIRAPGVRGAARRTWPAASARSATSAPTPRAEPEGRPGRDDGAS